MPLLIILLFLFPRPAIAEAQKITIHELISQWGAIENSLAQDDTETTFASLDDFRDRVQTFLSSSLYRLYRHTLFTGENPLLLPRSLKPRDIPEIQTIPEQLQALRHALEQNDRNSTAVYSAGITESLFRLLDFDRKAEDYVKQGYFRLFMALAAFILLMFLAVKFLGRALSRSIRQEQKTSTYSRLILAAQEEERSRIARELHDSVISGLRHLSFLTYTKDIGQAQISEGCDSLIRQVRDICCELSPPDFDRLGLLSSVRNLCDSFRASSGIGCVLVAPQTLKRAALLTEDQFHCFRIIQEALTNVEKYSKAGEASVLIEEDDYALVIIISDDGKGFAEQTDNTPAGTGLGIRSMRERAELLGGSLTVINEPDSGVIVKLEIPYIV